MGARIRVLFFMNSSFKFARSDDKNKCRFDVQFLVLWLQRASKREKERKEEIKKIIRAGRGGGRERAMSYV